MSNEEEDQLGLEQSDVDEVLKRSQEMRSDLQMDKQVFAAALFMAATLLGHEEGLIFKATPVEDA